MFYVQEEITGFLKKTKIDHSKAYYIADIIPKNSPSQEDFSSYDEVSGNLFTNYFKFLSTNFNHFLELIYTLKVCRGKSSNFDTWCIPHTKDFYDKVNN